MLCLHFCLLPFYFYLFLASVRFILLYFRQHPIEIAGRNFPAAELADAHHVHFQWRSAVRAIQISACCCGLGLSASYESPVFAPSSQVSIRPAHDFARLVYSVIVAFGEDSHGYRVIERILFDLHGLHREYLRLVECVAQPLALVRLYPVAVHLENIVCLEWTSALPLQRRPCGLQFAENETSASLELSP